MFTIQEIHSVQFNGEHLIWRMAGEAILEIFIVNGKTNI